MSPTPEQIEKVQSLIAGILEHLGIRFDISAEDSAIKGLVFNITSPNSYMLIGRDGANLHALEVVARAIVNKHLGGEWIRFSLDVDDYKLKREWYLKELTKEAGQKAVEQKKSQTLEPMKNFDRKFVHAYIEKEFPGLVSSSVGTEPNRRVVIRAK